MFVFAPPRSVTRFLHVCKAGFCLAALALTLGRTAAEPSQPVDPPCSPFGGTFVFTLFQFTGPTTAYAEADVYVDGQLAGTAIARYSNIDQKANGVTHMNGQHELTFFNGNTLVTHDEIRLHADHNNPGWASANSRLYIVDGSGDFEGATGLFITHGYANLFTLEGSIDFKGQVCVPE